MQKLLLSSSFIAFFAPVLLLLLPSFKLSVSYSIPFFLFLEYVINTVILSFGVGVLTLIFGVGSACVVSFVQFPGRNFVKYMLFLPLAVPPYVSALGYASVLEFSGPFCTLVRDGIGIDASCNIRSVWGAIFVLSISFYPYIYSIVLARLSSVGSLVAVSRMCGKTFLQTALQVLVPVSRPAIVAGLALVLMEVISDFGVVQFFGVQTLSTGIYRAWFLLHDSVWASRLVLILLAFIVCLMYMEKKSRKLAFYSDCHLGDVESCWKFSGKKGVSALLALVGLPFFGFIMPILSLIFLSAESNWNTSILSLTFNSFLIALIASFIVIFAAAFLTYLSCEKKISQGIFQFSTLGYAIPGLVVGMSVMNFLSYSTQIVDFISELFFTQGTNLLLIGTFSALLYSYVFRFLALGTSNLQSGMEKIPKEIHWTLKLMGKTGFANMAFFYTPMMIRYIVSGFILVFVDVLKELSATLVVRPFNFDTMSTKVYELVMDERYADAAFPALISTGVCFLSIIVLIKLLYSKSLHNSGKKGSIKCFCDVCINGKSEVYC
jgi:iron(III) transport system permease protein